MVESKTKNSFLCLFFRSTHWYMAKKKSLKAKLAKKAKASTQSPNRNGSPANPEPSTSKHNTEQAPKVLQAFS